MQKRLDWQRTVRCNQCQVCGAPEMAELCIYFLFQLSNKQRNKPGNAEL